jgi:hypothetical protein
MDKFRDILYAALIHHHLSVSFKYKNDLERKMPMSKLPKCSGTFGNAVPQPTELITSTSASVCAVYNKPSGIKIKGVNGE